MTEITIYFDIRNSSLIRIQTKKKKKEKHGISTQNILFIPTQKRGEEVGGEGARRFHMYNVSFNNSSGILIMQLPVALLSCTTETTDRNLKSLKTPKNVYENL